MCAPAERAEEDSALAELCRHLRPLLQYELLAGNRIASHGRGGFDGRMKLLVMLEKPFHRSWDSTLLRQYVHIHDPHYWEDEYNCLWHKHCLASEWQTGRGCGRRP